MMLHLLILLALLWPGDGWGATAHVKHASSDNTAINNPTATFAGSTTSSNLICGAVAYDSAVTLNSVTDSKGNTYSIVRTVTDALNLTKLSSFYAKNITGGASHAVTANLSATSTYALIAVHEVSGADTSTPLDVETGQVQVDPTGTDGISSGSVSTSTNGQYVFAGSFTSAPPSSSTAFSAGTSYTLRVNDGYINTLSKIGTESRIQTSSGSIAGTFTRSETGMDYMTVVMTFKEAGGGAASVNRLTLLGVGQ